jgi:hypothetical protein
MWNGISIVKNDENQDELKNYIWKIIYIGKCILQLNYSFYGVLFDITMTYFLSPHFFFLCVTNIVSSFQKYTMNPFFS